MASVLKKLFLKLMKKIQHSDKRSMIFNRVLKNIILIKGTGYEYGQDLAYALFSNKDRTHSNYYFLNLPIV